MARREAVKRDVERKEELAATKIQAIQRGKVSAAAAAAGNAAAPTDLASPLQISRRETAKRAH